MQTRALATNILNRLCAESVTLNYLLDEELSQLDSQREKSFARDLCFGVMRWHPQLDIYLQSLLSKPIRKKNFKLRILCWLGLYQIAYQRTPDHGAVSATVAACDELSLPWAKGMVNAILRNFIRRKQELMAENTENEIARFAHPQWLIDIIKQDWPEHWQSILEENNKLPPMCLRINRSRTSITDYQELLQQKGYTSQKLKYCEDGLMLDKACEIADLPGFAQGLVSVQDGAAQLAISLLDLQPGLRVLDACAAPGGKTCHILEQEAQLQELVAVDINPDRLQKISRNLDRLSLTARTVQADVADTDKWWNGQCFDRILLDAPCSATGVIRRHPDIKYLRKSADVEQIILLQGRLLQSLWPLLATGGKLVYVTCSVLIRENDDVIRRFLELGKNTEVEKINAGWGYETEYGCQILPGQDNLDGFYFACLVKLDNDT